MSQDIFNDDNARTNEGDKIVESSERIGSRHAVEYVTKEMNPLNILLLDARSWEIVTTCQGIIEQ